MYVAGVCYMMWQMFIMKRMSAAAHLMEKVNIGFI